MKRLRSLLFWIHLAAGVVAGLVILVMSITGALLAFKPQIQRFVDRNVRVVQPPQPGAPRLGVQILVANARLAKPDGQLASIALDGDPTASAAVSLGREGTIYVDPYTGQLLGEGSRSLQTSFRTLEDWHRWLGSSAENRATGRAVTAACNLAFLGLAISGLYLWWPRRWLPQHVRAILMFRRQATGRARDFNWHNVIGFWCAPVLIVLTTSGVVMSYPWANNLLYRMAGSPLPSGGERGGGPGRAGGPGGAGRAGGAGEAGGAGGTEIQRQRRPSSAPGTGDSTAGGSRGGGDRVARGDGASGPTARGARSDSGEPPRPAALPNNLDQLWARAEQQVPTWRSITMRLPNRAAAPVSFTLTDAAQWNAFARSQLTLDATTAAVVRWEPYADNSLGQKMRGWVRFAHTGELGGVVGQTLAGIACLGGVFLVWTGLALAWRRLLGWIGRRRPVASTRAVSPSRVREEEHVA